MSAGPGRGEGVDAVSVEELVQGVVADDSRDAYLAVIDRLVARGSQGIVAGCTEIELLVGADDVTVPYLPTTQLHVEAAIDMALAGVDA